MGFVRASRTSGIGTRVTATGVAVALATIFIIGMPTAVIPSPWFSRTIATRWWDYLVLGFTALLAGAIGGTYALPAACPINSRRLTLGGALSYFAVGCPLCNKMVLLVLGAGGALTYFQPFQPVLALGSLGLLGVTLWARITLVRATWKDGTNAVGTGHPS
jgi:hypothetical protein